VTVARRFLPLLAAAVLALGGAAAAAAPVRVPAQARQDWTRTVVATPEGGFRMGNPAAAVKVVEYVSLTCPHCRHFAEAGAPVLIADHVASGRVSFEIRPFPLDPIAAIGSQLNRCAAPDRAFAFNDAILASQESWFARLDALGPAELAGLNGLHGAALRQRVAALAGFDAIAASHGVDAASCLADDAGAARIDEIKAAAEALGVQGTPSFLINGTLAPNAYDWAALEPLLRAGR
jgi:protein-disulfide isomerase